EPTLRRNLLLQQKHLRTLRARLNLKALQPLKQPSPRLRKRLKQLLRRKRPKHLQTRKKKRSKSPLPRLKKAQKQRKLNLKPQRKQSNRLPAQRPRKAQPDVPVTNAARTAATGVSVTQRHSPPRTPLSR